MSRIDRHALVMHSASRMYELVNNVAAYPTRFSWCEQAQVLEHSDLRMLARLTVKVGALRASFTTCNTLQFPTRIDLQLVDGPFRQFEGAWSFHALDEQACKVRLQLNFEPAGALLGSAFALGFQKLADRLVDDFCRAADIPDLPTTDGLGIPR